MRKLLMASVMLAFASSALAQTYQPDVASSSGGNSGSDYGSLLRQATAGKEPVAVPVEVVSHPNKVAPKSAATKSSEKPPKTKSRAGEYLHSAAEYANEAHHVRLVDRSPFDSAYLPVDLANTMRLAPGAIYIDTRARQLYFAKSTSVVRRYGVSVGKDGAAWKGDAIVGRTAKWPDWRPTENIRRENKKLKALVKGGPGNPLGARALYLFSNGADTLFRIHGTTAPLSIGKNASHGCIRMINEDVIELHALVRTGAVVYVR